MWNEITPTYHFIMIILSYPSYYYTKKLQGFHRYPYFNTAVKNFLLWIWKSENTYTCGLTSSNMAIPLNLLKKFNKAVQVFLVSESNIIPPVPGSWTNRLFAKSDLGKSAP